MSSPQALTLSDLPPVEEPGSEGARRRPRPRREPSRLDWNRRQLLERVMAAGTGLALASLGLLPPARRALASHRQTGYRIWERGSSGPCGAGGYAVNQNCNPGCGPSDVAKNACVDDPEDDHYGFHKSKGKRWRLRQGQCWSSSYDGWEWKFRPSGGNRCHGCKDYITWRCHDGYKCDDNGNNCIKTICRHKVKCDGKRVD